MIRRRCATGYLIGFLLSQEWRLCIGDGLEVRPLRPVAAAFAGMAAWKRSPEEYCQGLSSRSKYGGVVTD